MEIDNMLRGLYRLTEKELGYEDYTDVTMWAEKTKFTFDTTELLEKSRERIVQIYNKHFES